MSKIYFNKIKNKLKGFTVLELIIVIAIIGILSSITLTVISNAKIKAKNTRIDLYIREYQNGLKAFASLNGHFPYTTQCPISGTPSFSNGGTLGVCLGEYPNNGSGEGCGFFIKEQNSYSTFEDPLLNSQLLDQMGALPSIESIPISIPNNYSGIIGNNIRGAFYNCTGFNQDGSVNEVQIRYFKIKSGQECLPGAIYETAFDFLNVSSCVLTIKY